MLSKTFKFVLAVTVATSLYFGFTAIQDAKANEPLYNPNGEQLIEADEPVLVGTLPFIHGNGVDFGISSESLNSLLESCTAKYLWIDEVDHIEEGTHNVYSVSEETFMNNVKEYHEKSSFAMPKGMKPIYSKSTTLMELAELLIDNLTSLNGSTSTGLLSSYYLTSFQPQPWTCLNGEEIDTDFPYQYFEENNLKLVITDPVASTIIGGSKRLSYYPIYGVLVTANVQTSLNTGKFTDLDWIPNSGETNSVNFLVFFTNSNITGAGNSAHIVDIAVLSSTPVI